VKKFVIDELVDFLRLRETLVDAVFVFPNSAAEIARDADIKAA
jgi:hypothetical protein